MKGEHRRKDMFFLKKLGRTECLASDCQLVKVLKDYPSWAVT